MKRHHLALLTAAVLVASLPQLAPAQEEAAEARHAHSGHGRHARGMRGFGDPAQFVRRMQRHLDLDEAQRQGIENVLLAAKPEMDELRARARTHREAVAALDPASADYAAALEQLSVESGQLAAEKMRLHGRVRADIAAQLTAEQRAELDAVKNERHERRAERRERRDNRHD